MGTSPLQRSAVGALVQRVRKPTIPPEALPPQDVGDAEWSSWGRPTTAYGHLAGWIAFIVLGAIIWWFLIIRPVIWVIERLSS